jgi:hypothetical protein
MHRERAGYLAPVRDEGIEKKVKDQKVKKFNLNFFI